MYEFLESTHHWYDRRGGQQELGDVTTTNQWVKPVVRLDKLFAAGSRVRGDVLT